jgi:hypothetical protein
LFPYEHTVRYETVARAQTEARIDDALIEAR